MRAAKRAFGQGANGVGVRPGRGSRCAHWVQVRRITGRSGRGPARPWPAPATGARSRGARTMRDRRSARTRGSGCAARRQSTRCAPAARPASAARCGAPGTCSQRSDAPSSHAATAPTPPAARPSRTSAEARCTPAAASTCARRLGTGNAGPPLQLTRSTDFGTSPAGRPQEQ